MNRIYEELFILRPDIPEEEITPVIEQLRGIITQAGGTVDKEERWGIRKLAYRIEKKSEGFYVLLQFTSPASTVKEVERRLRVNDAVLKYLTVRIDEKLKWLEKRKKAREKRAARKPAVAPLAPSMPTDESRPAMPSLPGAPMPGAPAGPSMPVAELESEMLAGHPELTGHQELAVPPEVSVPPETQAAEQEKE
ncbi:MAG: 30S ribosomal protein S6 [Bryobacteraceae bacterium]|nr:30S ribosomal protein S6 [Bryobacteraceae bacterium]